MKPVAPVDAPDKGDFHGRRHGRPLRPGRHALLARWLPRLTIELPEGTASVDPRRLFEGERQDVWLEIGFGAGEHLLAQAERHPRIGFIGCEPFQNGIAAMLPRLVQANLGNVRVFAEDARPLLRRLAPASIDRAFILFPDPWPKRKHWKRRLIADDTCRCLASILKPAARLHVATDHPGYLRWILITFARQPAFQWLAEGPGDWRAPWPDWHATRYQMKALHSAAVCTYLTFIRR